MALRVEHEDGVVADALHEQPKALLVRLRRFVSWGWTPRHQTTLSHTLGTPGRGKAAALPKRLLVRLAPSVVVVNHKDRFVRFMGTVVQVVKASRSKRCARRASSSARVPSSRRARARTGVLCLSTPEILGALDGSTTMTNLLRTYIDPLASHNIDADRREAEHGFPQHRASPPTKPENSAIRWWVVQYETAGRALLLDSNQGRPSRWR